MCGIVGKISFNNQSISENELKKMADTIVHRGPDDEGYWINDDKFLGFGHRRLSILDLSEKGKQPMHYQDCSITYNGEIYNYLEIRSELINKGHEFYSDTDTEVVLAAYKEYGQSCLNYFDGMFAFVIWDDQNKILFGARDRFGEKPFYYFKDKTQYMFASEMKALFSLNIPKQISSKMLYNYLVYDVVENPQDKSETFYENILQLPPSHYFTLTLNGEFTLKKYWDININKQKEISSQEAIERFTDLFMTSVKRRMRSDVKVGTSLSGGIDSSSVVASIINNFPDINLNTFTARFNDEDYDEGYFINVLKNKYEFNSHYTWPKESLIIDELNNIFHHQEEPFGSSSIIAQWEVMKKAKEQDVTVLLDGQGADETMGGYYKYFLAYLHELYKNDPKSLNTELNSIENELGLKNYLPKSFYFDNKFSYIKQTIADSIRPHRIHKISPDLSREFRKDFKYEKSPFHVFTDLNSALYFDTFNYGLGKLLRFSDRNAMAFSREVRLPYLSHEIVEFLFNLPSIHKMNNGWSKKILRDSMNNILPYEIAWRKDKKGFQAPNHWLENKFVMELKNESINKLKREKIISEPDSSKTWQYIMSYKLISND